MARKPATVSAHDQLDQLRQQAAAERVRARDLEARLQAVEAEVLLARERIIQALADDDEQAALAARRAGEQSATESQELGERVAAVTIRVQRAQELADRFAHDNAGRLLDERLAVARAVTESLNTSVRETVKLHRQLQAERQDMDRIISGGGGSPRSDGAEPSHAWEQALNDLARVVQQHPLAAPEPRWQGRQYQQERDHLHAVLQAQREGDQLKVEELQRQGVT